MFGMYRSIKINIDFKANQFYNIFRENLIPFVKIRGTFNKFPYFFVQAFKIVVYYM